MLTPKTLPYQDRWWSSADGLRLYGRDYPASAGRVRLPVICLHGLTRNSADFETVAPHIAHQDRRVIVPDIRGRGRSQYDSDPSRYHLWTYAQDIIGFCDAAGIAKAVFVGTSMGGLISMVISTLRPALIHACVLNDVGPVLSAVGLQRIAAYASAGQSRFRTLKEAAARIAEANQAAYPSYGPKAWERFASRVCEREPDGQWRPAYDPRISNAFKAAPVTSSTFDMAACYVSLATARRILLIRGALSDLLTESDAVTMAGLSPDFQRVDVAGIGHAPVLDEPEARTAIDDFMNTVD